MLILGLTSEVLFQEVNATNVTTFLPELFFEI